MNSHHSYVLRKPVDKPVAIHFNSPSYTIKDLQVIVIDQLRKKDTVLRKIREDRWISTPNTGWPKGLNLRTDG